MHHVNAICIESIHSLLFPLITACDAWAVRWTLSWFTKTWIDGEISFPETWMNQEDGSSWLFFISYRNEKSLVWFAARYIDDCVWVPWMHLWTHLTPMNAPQITMDVMMVRFDSEYAFFLHEWWHSLIPCDPWRTLSSHPVASLMIDMNCCIISGKLDILSRWQDGLCKRKTWFPIWPWKVGHFFHFVLWMMNLSHLFLMWIEYIDEYLEK